MADNTLMQVKKYPRASFLKRDPQAANIVNKLVKSNHTGTRTIGSKSAPNANYVQSVSDTTTRNVNDSTNIFQLLPDTELAMQILVSSILSPKDMVNVELGYRTDSRIIDSEVSGPMIEVIREYFDEIYNIEAILPSILEESLFTKGSYPIMVLPENSVDDIINNGGRVSVESIRPELGNDDLPKRSVGILGSPNGRTDDVWSVESTKSNTYVNEDQTWVNLSDLGLENKLSVSDNFDVLKFPRISEKIRKNRLDDALGVRGFGMEARSRRKPRVSDQEFAEDIFSQRNYERRPFVGVKAANEISKDIEGHPLVMKLPPEAVIPVHVPSNPEDHIGYFVLLDQYGNPLNRTHEADYYRDLTSNLQSSASSQLMERLQASTHGINPNDDRQIEESEAVRLYANVVEKDLVSRLKNGVYGENVEISRPLDVYRVMLGRALSSMGTQILYVPSELVTYIAFDHNQYGVGKSLLEDNKILANLRSMLMFSSTMASIRNSVGHTGLKIDLDPDDPDPASTVNYMVSEYMRNRGMGYPLGASTPREYIDFLQNAGIDIQVSGNAAYPETTLSAEERSTNHVKPDTELEEDIKRRFFMSLGLSPETIDQTSDVEFATSVVTSNLLLAKRVIRYQTILTFFLRDFMAKYVRNSSVLWESLMEAVNNNKSSLKGDLKKMSHEEIVDMFLETFVVTLPRPDSAKLENQMEAFQNYSDALEFAVDAYLGEDGFMLREFDDVEETIRAARTAVISYFKRQWLRNNNVLPELMSIVSLDDEGVPELEFSELHGDHLETIGKSLNQMIIKMKKDRQKREEEIRKQEEKMAEKGEGPVEGGPTASPVGTTMGAGGDDDLGGDDLGGGDDDETPTDEPAPDETTEEEEEGAPEEEENTSGGEEEEGNNNEEEEEEDDT